jgi:hypothetical protein
MGKLTKHDGSKHPIETGLKQFRPAIDEFMRSLRDGRNCFHDEDRISWDLICDALGPAAPDGGPD